MSRAKSYALILNAFIHDFATASWVAAVIVCRLLHAAHLDRPEVADVLGELERLFFWGAIVAAVVTFATGGGRAASYKPDTFGPDSERDRRRILIVKHIILLVVYAAGSAYAYFAAYHG